MALCGEILLKLPTLCGVHLEWEPSLLRDRLQKCLAFRKRWVKPNLWPFEVETIRCRRGIATVSHAQAKRFAICNLGRFTLKTGKSPTSTFGAEPPRPIVERDT